jgi:hypothetical protein
VKVPDRAMYLSRLTGGTAAHITTALPLAAAGARLAISARFRTFRGASQGATPPVRLRGAGPRARCGFLPGRALRRHSQEAAARSPLDGTPLLAATRYAPEVLSSAFDRVWTGSQRSGWCVRR